MAENFLLATHVAHSVRRLGEDLRIARLRRDQTIEDLARRVGTTPSAIRGAETGEPTIPIAVYAAILGAMGLLGQLDAVARPDCDTDGQSRALLKERRQARFDIGPNTA